MRARPVTSATLYKATILLGEAHGNRARQQQSRPFAERRKVKSGFWPSGRVSGDFALNPPVESNGFRRRYRTTTALVKR